MNAALASEDAATSAAGPRADSLADTVVVLLLLAVFQRVVGFLRSVLLCRWLDPEQLGQWDMAFGFLLLAAPVAVLGLPGSFGRYVEHYRQRGQLQSFLRHLALWIAALALAAVAFVGWQAEWFSQVVFGRGDCDRLVRMLAASLASVILYNSLSELFTALRLARGVSVLQFGHSVLFAALAAGLVLGWRAQAQSVVAAYGLSSLVCCLAGFFWLGRSWHCFPSAGQSLSQTQLLTKLLPFAVWVWVTNWLFNLFDIVARYMIVHHSGLSADEALVQVGNYHSARVVPLLLVSISALLGTAALPHLSHDWERGDREAVSRRVNLMLKLVTLALVAGGVAILATAPLVFDVAFAGKYNGGRDVLHLTLVACLWFGVIGLAQNYLWCAEKARLGSMAMLAGVAVNVGLNLVLLPRFGLAGAIASTAAANLATLALNYAMGIWCGLRFDPGVCIVLALPLAFCGGLWTALVALLLASFWAWRGQWLLTGEEKRLLITVGSGFAARLGYASAARGTP